MEQDGKTFNELYLKFMSDLVDKDGKHSDLLALLHSIKFLSKNPLDSNRVADAYVMREEFKDGYEGDSPAPFDVKRDWGYEPSALEVLVAMAKRMEDDIFFDPDKGNQTWKWFKVMMKNLGIWIEDSEKFPRDEIMKKVNKWMTGEISMFPCKDWKSMDIWNQMQLFMGSYEGKGKDIFS